MKSIIIVIVVAVTLMLMLILLHKSNTANCKTKTVKQPLQPQKNGNNYFVTGFNLRFHLF